MIQRRIAKVGSVMAADLMAQGLELMLAGMGTVFVFLSVLVAATVLMSRFVMRFQPRPAASTNPSAEEVAVITAAIAAHRRRPRD